MDKEIEQFKKENCSKCKKNIDCEIVRRIDGKLTCTEEEQNMEYINYANCMRRKCEQCRYYDYCFGYKLRRSKKKNDCKQVKNRNDKNK